jgi:FMNH2-dependent dimethyl sulfone monooxygenase
LSDLDNALARVGRPESEVVKTVGITVRDTDQPAVPEPSRHAIDGSVDEVAKAMKDYEALGVGHLIAHVEPMTPRSVERLAEAKRLAST